MKYTHRILFKAIALAIVCLFLANDIAFCESSLAPTLSTKPICEVVRKPDGSFDVVTDTDVIESWDKETVRSYRQGVEASGKAFRNRWALMDVGYIIGQMLILTQEHKLQNPKDILIPLIKKHIRNRAGEAEILLEEYNIDGIEEVREGDEVKGFSLPVTRSSALSYKLVYNLQSGDTSIPLKDGKTVYIRVEKVASRQEMETIERVGIALRSMSPHASFEMDIFEFFGAVIMMVYSFAETPSLTIESIRQQQHHIAVKDLFERLKKIVNEGKAISKEGQLSIAQAENYTAQIQEILTALEKEREDIYFLIQQEKQINAEAKKLAADLQGPFGQIIDILRSRIELIHKARSYDLFTMDNVIQKAAQGLTGEKFITVRSDQPALLSNIRGNRLSLINALANIIQNAASFAEEKQGDAAKVNITLSKENDLIKIDIEDNGGGIPQELLKIDAATGRPRLFNLNVSEREGGTGLGTTEAWYAVKDMGGTIDVRSEAGKGTTFTIRLPSAETKIVEEIDKSSVADIFPKSDYLTYLIIYMTGGAMVALDREAREVGEALGSMHKRLDGALENEFIRRQLSSSDDVRDFYLWFAQLIKDDLQTARELLSLVQYPRHKRNMAQGVPFAESFVNGIELLLDGSDKRVDINDTLEKILDLTFSPYYRNRDYKYTINKQLSPDIPAISARQDKIAYLLLSLVLSLREMREADLDVSTRLTSDKGIKYITVTMSSGQEIPLSNVIVDKKDTGIGFELAKGIAQSYGGTIDVRSDAGKGTVFTVRLPLATTNSYEAPVITSPESESIHVTNLQDTLTYIQTQSQSQPLIIALGTSWIKGYEKGRYLQYDALNPLIGSLRTYCESKGIPFIVDADDKLLAQINAERAKDGMSGAKVVVLAGESTVTSDEFAGLRADEKNAFVVGVNNQELTTDSYIRLLEMLTIALKLSAGLEISLDNVHIAITKDNERRIYIFLPHADPMDYERLKVTYEVQKFA